MRSTAFLTSTAFILTLFCFSRSSDAATAEQVQDAIERGTKYIYSQMHGDNWEIAPSRDPKVMGGAVTGAQWGGMTAISTYALLAAGESPQDPRLAKAIEFLRTADLVGTYSIALRSQVWLNVPKNDRIRDAIAKDAKLMLLSARTAGPNKGEFTYANAGPKGGSDHSNSQYGVLGLWADSEAVEGIPDEFWANADESWRSEQGDDGSWGYNAKPGSIDLKGLPVKGTATMTAAGIATLFITQDFLYRSRGLECTGNIVDKNITAGLGWMTKNFNQIFGGGFGFYGIYGLERIGVASGYKYFGDIDWYARGADAVIKAQHPDGSFTTLGEKAFGNEGAAVNTAFAMLFLSRGRAPVMMNKLQYQVAGAEANWNERPRDAYNIARWVGKETENTLNWQVTSISKTADEWHDAPILYIAGNQPLSFTPAEIVKLKTFVDQGGLILGSADCGRKTFSDSFRALGKKLFANYEFKTLPATDIIMHDEQFNAAKWRRKPTVLAMDNGARKLMILIPDADPAKAWQMQETMGKEELFQLAANIFLYAIDKQNLFFKGDTYIVEPNPAVRALKTIGVARLSYDGNWNPEPGGWWRLNAYMHNNDSLDVKTAGVDPAKDSLASYKIAHLTGTDSFKLASTAVTALQEFIKGGGTLVVDAAGGKTAFAEAADKALRLIFGDDANQLNEPLTEDSKLYTAGGKIDEISYRTFARAAMGGMKGPRLRGITKDGRLVCIYSPEDLSVGMVGEPVDGILGYSPATATELMRKSLLLASGDTPVKPIISAAKPPVKVPVKPPVPKPTTPAPPKPADQ